MSIAADHTLDQVVKENSQVDLSVCEPYSPLCGPMISIFVGPNSIHFMVHAEIMCSQSLYFRNRCKTPHKSNLNFQFPDIDPKDMALFTSSVYRLFWNDSSLDIGATPDEYIIKYTRLYLISMSFQARQLQENALNIVKLYIGRESIAWVHSMNAEKLEAHLQARIELIWFLYNATNKREDPLRIQFVESLGLLGDDYFDCSDKYGIDIGDGLEELFILVPEFAEDLKNLIYEMESKLCKRKGLTILAPLIEEDEGEEVDGKYNGDQKGGGGMVKGLGVDSLQ